MLACGGFMPLSIVAPGEQFLIKKIIGNVLRSMWETGWSFIKKVGTIILLSTIVIWFLSFFGWALFRRPGRA